MKTNQVNQHMVLELDRQVAHAHSHFTKVKDKKAAVSYVLDGLHVKMQGYLYTYACLLQTKLTNK